jgi:hypothetical protein
MTEPQTLQSWAISPECRINRTDDGAWDEAVARLRQVYDAQLARYGMGTFTLSISRSLPAMPKYVLDALASNDDALDAALGRCPAMIQCHRETGHDDPANPPEARRHEAAQEAQ